MARNPRDIDEKVRTAEMARQLSYAVEQSPTLVVITDADGAIEYINAKFTSVTGYSLEEIRGKNPRVLKSGSMPAEAYEQMWKTITAGQVWRGEFCNRKKSGEQFWVSASISGIRNEAGVITGFVGIEEDITERKKTEEALRAANEFAANVIESSMDMIITTDLERRITRFNRAAVKTFGYQPEEVLGHNVRLLYAERDEGLAVNEKLNEGAAFATTIRNRRKNGEVFESHLSASLLRDSHGRVIGYMGISRDLTEQRALEKPLLRSQRMESIGTLAGGIAHDLNNILAPILMSTEVLRLQMAGAESRKLLETVASSAQRGANIVRQVLTFARGIDGERVLVQMRHLLKDVARMAQETFPKNITLRQQAPADLWTVTGDGTQLHQVLLNLCVNARDAMPSGGTLSLAAENAQVDHQYAATNPDAQPGPYVMIRVKDTGCGIDPKIQDRIFEPFFTTKPQGQGTGLGLSTALGIVRSHGGFFQLDSALGRGSVFRIYLPATPDAQAPPAELQKSTAPRGNHELVLVVDDEKAVRDVTQATLEMHGYRVVTAADGVEGITQYAEHFGEVAVVLTDVMMPMMDGVALIRALRRVNPKVKVIASSGLASGTRKEDIETIGVEGFLDKPYVADRLIGLLHDVISRK